MIFLRQEVEDVLKEIDESLQECAKDVQEYKAQGLLEGVEDMKCEHCEWDARIKAVILGLMDEVAKLNGSYDGV